MASFKSWTVEARSPLGDVSQVRIRSMRVGREFRPTIVAVWPSGHGEAALIGLPGWIDQRRTRSLMKICDDLSPARGYSRIITIIRTGPVHD